jgi:hypothetical protein
VDEAMIVLGADTHKRSHTIAAVSAATGEVVGQQTVQVGATARAGLSSDGRPSGSRQGRTALGSEGTLPATASRVFGPAIGREVPVRGAADLNGLLASSPRFAG